ncbi:MAG: hypothetical protein PHP42_08780 [Bacteroidota bacterium]|nr:hypothetical protein [Bacteroidota bacterium]
MKHDEAFELLIEYAEGTLDDSRIKEVEKMLLEFPERRGELELLRHAFDELQKNEDTDIPSHYFTNFLPRLQDKIHQGTESKFQFIPSWLQTAIAPLVVLCIISSLVGLYQSLKPDEFSSAIYTIVKDIDQNQIDEATKMLTLFDNETNIAGAVEKTTRTQLPDKYLNQKLFTKDILASNTLDENIINDRQILSQLEDVDAEYILDQLHAIQ